MHADLSYVEYAHARLLLGSVVAHHHPFAIPYLQVTIRYACGPDRIFIPLR